MHRGKYSLHGAKPLSHMAGIGVDDCIELCFSLCKLERLTTRVMASGWTVFAADMISRALALQASRDHP